MTGSCNNGDIYEFPSIFLYGKSPGRLTWENTGMFDLYLIFEIAL